MNNDTIIAREARKVNKENVCCWPGCENETESGCPLCSECQKWEQEQQTNQDTDYIFGDHLLDTSWYGYKPEEVLA